MSIILFINREKFNPLYLTTIPPFSPLPKKSFIFHIILRIPINYITLKTMNPKPTSLILKFIIIGDTGVGKSCLLLHFIDQRFRLKHQPTIGVQFGAKTITTKGCAVKLQVWDTAGQQSFRSITRGYYRSAAGAVLAYDVTNRESFVNLVHWVTEARNSGNEEMSYVLVGNKCDLELERKVTYEQGVKFAKDNNMAFVETSAKTGYNVDPTFIKVTEIILDRIQNKQIDLNNNPPGIKIGFTKQAFQSENASVMAASGSGKSRSKCC